MRAADRADRDREVDDLANRYGIRRPEEKKRPPSVHSRPDKLQKSSQGVAEWKSHSYALVRDVVAAHKEMKDMLSKVHKKRTVIDTRTKALELAVNDALQLRVTETKRLEDRLATQAQRTQLDKEQIEQSIDRVEAFLREQEGQFDVTTACLEQRQLRPTRELVRDPVEERLENEYVQAEQAREGYVEGIDKLRQELHRLSVLAEQIEMDRNLKREAVDVDVRMLHARIGMNLPARLREKMSMKGGRRSERVHE